MLNNRYSKQVISALPARQKGYDRMLSILQSHVALKNKTILELGSDKVFYVASKMIEQGAKSVSATNILDHWQFAQEYIDEVLGSSIHAQKVDARELAQHYAPDSFDLVFAQAFVEHVQDIEIVLSQICSVLAKGGMVFMHGNPIWSSSVGHHVFLQAPSSRWYRFNDSPKVIPDWSHLMLSRSEFEDMLNSKDIPEQDIAPVSEFIYNSPLINRYPLSKLKELFSSSSLSLKKIIENRTYSPSREVIEKVSRGPWGDCGDLSVYEVIFILEKI
jgi:SAM-dependent methyltransferase